MPRAYRVRARAASAQARGLFPDTSCVPSGSPCGSTGGRRRLVGSGHRRERNREAVPAVDRNDCERQIDERLLVKVSPYVFVVLVLDRPVRDEGDQLGPSERGAFSLGEERRLAPRRKRVEALLRFSVR